MTSQTGVEARKARENRTVGAAARSSAKILPANNAAEFAVAVSEAAALLRQGELVALPTETVYGLAANALAAEAVNRIYEVKGRPAHNPIIVHVAGLEMARACVSEWPPLAEALAREFWPGPLTLVLPRSGLIPDVVTAGGNTVGIRWPSHPLMQAVIRECGFPLAAPSANPANRVSPTNANHVLNSLGDRIGLILDGGQSQVGIESTVVDLTTSPARILRPGMITECALQLVIDQANAQARATGSAEAAVANPPRDQAAPAKVLRSPGQLPRHYSPTGKLEMRSWKNEADLVGQLNRAGIPTAKVHVIAHSEIPIQGDWGRVSVIPHDAEAFARAIYAELHQCDAEGAEWIVVENLPSGTEWQAISDRLRRAAT